jgi:regulator of protease activity HflC (stomatin/prohibitin superfamily)
LAQAVKQALSGTMDKFGFQILQALITDLDPDARVKAAMNEINSSKRMKFAIMEQAEGAKILQVKSAEAEAEAKHLSGVGVAKQRRAIMDGLRTSIVDFGDGVEGTSPKDVMDLLLLSQYFDMLRETAGAPNCRTVFTSGAEETGRLGLLQASAGN